jgi:hypothetical protein
MNITEALRESSTPSELQQPWDPRPGVATVEPPPEPEAPPERPSLMARIGALFQKEKQTAKEQYLALLKKSSTRDLSAKEVEQLHAAMKAAGIGLDQLAKHQQLLESLPEARAAAERKKVADEAARVAHAEFVAHERNVFMPAKEQHERLFRAADEASGSANVHRDAAGKLQDIEEQIAKLFGE